MSDLASPDAAPGDPASASGPAMRRPVTISRPTRIEQVIRRWWVIVAGMIVALLVALIYLATATRLYTVTSIVACDRHLGAGGGGGSDLPADKFFGAQRDLIMSDPVLTAAVAAIGMEDRAKLVGSAHSAKALHDALKVRTSPSDQVIAISLESPAPQPAARVVNAVTEAYLKARGESPGGAAGDLAELTRQQDKLAVERAAAEKTLTDYRSAANLVGTDADKTALNQLEQLKTALAAAQAEVASSDAALKAANEMLTDPPRRDEVIEANRPRGIFGGLDQQKAQIDTELSRLEPQLERLRQTTSPQHPVFRTTSLKVEDLKQKRDALDKQYVDAYRTYIQQQRAAAQKKIDGMKPLIEAKSKLNADYAVKAEKLTELEANLKRADAALAEIDAKLNSVKISPESTGPRMGVVQAARAPANPTHPDWTYCLSSALLVGLVGGLILAAMGKSGQ